jgi:hypothetical protein
MAKLVVRPIDKGLRTDRLAFNIDNDSFPYLLNAYQWRGRIKRKRGTSFLARLTRFFNSTSIVYSAMSTINLVGGAANLLTGFSLQANGNIIPGTVVIVDTTATLTYTDAAQNGSLNPAAIITGATQANPCVLTANNSFSIGDKVVITQVQGMTQLNGNTYTITNVSPTTITLNVDSTGFSAYTMGGLASDINISDGTINYATGAITITGGGTDAISAKFLYYPDLPVMGLEDWINPNEAFPGTIGFDTTYSYIIPNVFPYNPYDVSFYKNPSASPPYNYTSYTPKTTVTPTSWNGQDYQQFWTVNYQGAFWATNGINIPFNTESIGMQFAPASAITYVSNTATTIVVTITGSPLVIGDFVFLNEWTGTNANTLNWQSGYVSAIAGSDITIKLPDATVGTGPYTPGIIQYLTNRSSAIIDCIRWFDGDPTNGSSTNPVLNGGFGWVNFMPPLSRAPFTIADLPQAIYYLVGARMIVPFKDRLLFIGAVVQSSTGSPVYLQDTVVYSQNGTPYYTASFTGDVSLPTTVFNPILTPLNQTATANAYFSDQTGFGGYISAGIDQPITTTINNEDVLIMGFSNRQTRLAYTGDDILPFNFFSINSELGSQSTFSGITLDRGAITIGPNGIILTSQVASTRIDLDIPDQLFEFNYLNNGVQRITAQRDFINEWIYFTYCPNDTTWVYPNQTLQYNYRDSSWSMFNESYTTYGQFRILQDATWATIGQKYGTWAAWNEPWSAGASTLLQPKVIGGNQQGFIVFRDAGTNESNTLYIQSISGTTITSPAHNLNNEDFIVINNCIGMTNINGAIFKVTQATANTFVLGLIVGQPVPTGTYVGGGTIQRMYVPYIQTKQFPVAWDSARKTRIGNQQYLFTSTANGQITLLIFLSMDDSNPYNSGPVVPSDNVDNSSLLYSTVLYTCPESTNLGLTPANINLQMITDPNQGTSTQNQIWHRMNTSLIGDTVQIGFTLSESQMTDTGFNSQFSEIELHGFILDVNPSQLLA